MKRKCFLFLFPLKPLMSARFEISPLRVDLYFCFLLVKRIVLLLLYREELWDQHILMLLFLSESFSLLIRLSFIKGKLWVDVIQWITSALKVLLSVEIAFPSPISLAALFSLLGEGFFFLIFYLKCCEISSLCPHFFFELRVVSILVVAAVENLQVLSIFYLVQFFVCSCIATVRKVRRSAILA